MKDPELARGPSFISDLGRSNREERSDGSRHPRPPNRAQRSDGSRDLGPPNRAQRSDGSIHRTYLSVAHIVVGILGTAIVVMYAVNSGRLVATDSPWYRSLVKPSWQPPRIVIGLIWPYNFVMLTTATWIVAYRLSSTEHLVWLISLTLSVLAALAWAWLFFHPHRLFASSVALVFATLFAIPLLVISFRASQALGIAFVPYQLWLILATSIAFAFSAQ